MSALLNSDWHGVPAGTALNVISRYTDVQGTEILVVERVDGGLLPTPWWYPSPVGNIAAEFVTEGASA